MIKYLKIAILVMVLYAFCFQPIVNKYIYIGVEIGIVLFYLLGKGTRDFFGKFRKEFTLFCLIVLYSLFLDMFGGEVVYVDRFAACLMQGLFFTYVFSSFIQNNSFYNDNFERALIIMAFVASSISILAIINPSFDSIIKAYTPEYDVAYERYEATIRHRLYGLSENLAFTYPYVLSVIGFYSIVEKNNIASLLLLIMVSITTMFNARIAFIPLLLIIPFLLLFKKGNAKSFLRFFVIILASILLLKYVLTHFSEIDSSWGLSFFEELFSLLTTGHSGTTDELTGRMFFLPDESLLSLLFGTGESVFLSSTHNSDVGYVIQTYYGGFIFLLLILSLMIYMSSRAFKILGRKNWFAFIFFFSIFVLNFKGFYFASTPGFRFLSLLYVYYILKKKRTASSIIVKTSNVYHEE
jgi:hypothetical protein